MTQSNEAGPSSSNSGIASPHDLAYKSIEDNLITELRSILKNKVQATTKCDFLRNHVARNFLPKGVPPKVPIKIVDPPPSLKEKWEAALMECGNKLTRILIDFHKDQILHFKELAQDLIMRGSQIIIPE